MDLPPTHHDHPRPPAPAEPHEPGPPAKRQRTCHYRTPCVCKQSGFCSAAMSEVVNMLERGR